MSKNIFADEWLECLRAHYMHVIRTDDRVTQPSLTVVMRQAGFDDTELAELRVRATMRAEDVPHDFVPDLDVLNHPAEPSAATESPVFPVSELPSQPEPAAPIAEVVQDIQLVEDVVEAEVELPADELPEEPLAEDLEAELLSGELDDESEVEEEKEDPDAPQQLTLF